MRIGAILTLERIARDNAAEHIRVFETLIDRRSYGEKTPMPSAPDSSAPKAKNLPAPARRSRSTGTTPKEVRWRTGTDAVAAGAGQVRAGAA